jgi:hypothetical protein
MVIVVIVQRQGDPLQVVLTQVGAPDHDRRRNAVKHQQPEDANDSGANSAVDQTAQDDRRIKIIEPIRRGPREDDEQKHDGPARAERPQRHTEECGGVKHVN